MGLNVGGGDRCFVSCDDPHAKGCVSKTEWRYGQKETMEMAQGQGWHKSESTGRWTCPPCRTEL